MDSKILSWDSLRRTVIASVLAAVLSGQQIGQAQQLTESSGQIIDRGMVFSMTWADSGKQLIVGSGTGIWSFDSGNWNNAPKHLPLGTGGIGSLVSSAGGKRIAWIYDDHRPIVVADPVSGKVVDTIDQEGPEFSRFTSVILSKDGSRAASIWDDGTLHVIVKRVGITDTPIDLELTR